MSRFIIPSQGSASPSIWNKHVQAAWNKYMRSGPYAAILLYALAIAAAVIGFTCHK